MRKNILLAALIVTSIVIVFALTVFGGKNTNTDKKAILVVSFGTSFVQSREVSIDKLEKVIGNSFPNYAQFRVFTSQTIIDIYQSRDNLKIMNVNEAIEKIYKEGYGEVLIVPTLVINGEEVDQIHEALEPFKDKFEKIAISLPLLSKYEDYLKLIAAMKKEFPKTDKDEAIVLMGHGTKHHANSAYGTLDYIFKDNGYENVFVGTVEGFPTYETVLKNLKKGGYKKVVLMPSMTVAGDHAHNDMAGDEGDSWKNLFKSEGFEVKYILKGLGELDEIQKIFIEHAKEAIQNK